MNGGKGRNYILKKQVMKNKTEGSDNPTNQFGSPAGGPQFDLKNTGGWGKQFKEWVNKYGSSIILPIIALSILAGGIYLYSSQEIKDATLSLEENSAVIQEEFNLTEESVLAEEAVESAKKEAEEEVKTIIPESRKENGMIIEKAAPGEGITHLARRALKNYTENNPENLANEHKIYIEDYLKDQVGPRPLEAGEEIAFSEDLIKEAINASLELSPEQLKNLEKYSALVVSW